MRAISASNSSADQESLAERLAGLRARILKDDFICNRGLSNEVGFHIFAYAPEQELYVREWTARLVADSEAGALATPDGVRVRVVERNLWRVFLSVCEQKLGPYYQAKMEKLEERRGADSLLGRMQKIASPDVFAQAMDYGEHMPGDVLLVTGVGMVYPFTRLHNVLENMQSLFDDVPVLALYPGTYDGQRLSLFSRLEDGNYYRAFQAV